jgi:hypothetical protein
VKIPILNLDNVCKYEQLSKVYEEMQEWQEGEPFSENDIEESFDIIQSVLGYLLKVVPDICELEKYAEKHCQKLASRQWDTNGEIELQFHYK